MASQSCPWVCPNCNQPIYGNVPKCQNCGVWALSKTSIEEEPAKTGIVKLSDVETSDYARGTTGLIDHCLGGGIVHTSTILLAGSAGAGKSTLSLSVAKNLIMTGQGFSPVLYIAAEEALGDIKARAVRIGIERFELEHIHMIDAMGGFTLDDMIQVIQADEPGLIILDSLQGLCGKDYAAHVLVCQALKRYAKDNEAPAIILGHFNKEDDYAGETSLAHAVDCVLMFTGDPKRPERLLHCPQKNRFGPTPASQNFIHTATGLQPVT